jgi:isoleucyl-tRNA synthetase
MAMPQWYLSVDTVKEKMQEANAQINWVPEHIKEGRFGKWLDGARDWAISRTRFWGTPLPVWVNETTGNTICIGSFEELEKYTGQKVDDLHRETVDDLDFKIDGEEGEYKRIPEVFDCWFESGSMPYAQLHYPFENKEMLDNREYLSDYICEGMDQTRGWFYTLMVLSTAIFDKAPYKNVMCCGMVLDKDGKKFSKKLGNYEDPTKLIEDYGSDTLRTYILKSTLMNADSLKFNPTHIQDTKKSLIPYYNAITYFLTYTKFYKDISDNNFVFSLNASYDNILDKWFIERVNKLIFDVNQNMELYKINISIIKLIQFIDDLCNWYIKFNRDRLKGNDGNDEMNCTLNILYYGLYNFTIMMAPFTPFYSEEAYKSLKNFKENSKESVFLESYPSCDSYDEDILKTFKDCQEICLMSRTMRTKTKHHTSIMVPLKNITIYHNSEEYLEQLKNTMIYFKNEINCDEFIFENLSSSTKYIIKPNLKNIGRKFKKQSKYIVKYMEELNNDNLITIHQSKFIQYEDDKLDEDYYELIIVASEEDTETSKIMLNDD